MATAKKLTKKTPSKKRKETSKEIQKPLSKEQIKKRLGRVNYYSEHPDSIYEKLGKLLIKNTEDWSEEDNEYLQSHVRCLDNFTRSHVGLAETQQEGSLRTTVVELANNLIEEYQCDTTLEKSLCEIIAENYGKVMQISKKFTGVMLAGEYLCDERTRYLGMLSKEKEKAERMYLASTQSLIDMKRPQSNIHIKTNTAYMAQYQQINTNLEDDVEKINTK